MIPHSSPWLSRYTKLLVGATFLLIVAGGLVTSTGSGLSVPDWPLSYGEWMPPMVGGIRYEHTHRMIATLVGFMTLVLVLWLGVRERRAWVRWIGITAFGMVVLQGILGAITVLYLLPAPVSILHACLAQTFFALIVSLSFFTSKEWIAGRGAPMWAPEASDISSRSGQAHGPAPTDVLIKMLFFLIILIYTQLILGATFRHTENLLIMVSHIASGFLIVLQAVLVIVRGFSLAPRDVFASAVPAGRQDAKQSARSGIASGTSCPRNDRGRRKLLWLAVAIGVITVVQMSLGMGAFIYRVMLPKTILASGAKIFFTTTHQALGALLLGLCVFVFLRMIRLERVSAP